MNFGFIVSGIRHIYLNLHDCMIIKIGSKQFRVQIEKYDKSITL